MSRARRLVVALVLLVALVGADLARAPRRQVSARALVGAIHLYQRTLSPWTSLVGARCRFEPSCSHYAEVVIGRLGTFRGLMLTASRLARCGVWTPDGTVDPPPVPGAQTRAWKFGAESTRMASQ